MFSTKAHSKRSNGLDLISVLMTRVEICPDITLSAKNTHFPINNVQ